ncbi:hypothetical protein FNF29_06748 [Cafeteria roenbergensis]|uniref:DNA-directed DNA polymerase family A palm domain-containing protein n=2 Tax=Cafeteria roenbergensis TaxID=33653 RepID=A0A5A8C934_CAFRO|nr:hypothetical protein FNF29_06748 [Cafeteria roenbergensis]|eukprot:KAA0148361.1 hypothetical protein FNF29_06748 [Cafeteria roenbergensis]
MATTAAGGGFALGDSAAVARAVNAEIDLRGEGFQTRLNSAAAEELEAAAKAGSVVARGGRTDTRDHGQATGGGASRANEAIVELPGRAFACLDPFSSTGRIELRVMAHLSADPGLVALFRSEADVFRTVAAQWLSRTASEVSDEERTQAKRLIYGVLYGMAPRRLAAEVGWSMDRARREVASIQRAFPGLVRFRASMERFCRAHSHVATIIGRRRWLPGIGDKSAAKRARARRQAFSTAVQGSAADIFRQALVRVTRVVEGINALHRAGALCAGAASAVRPSSGLRVRSGPLGGHPASAGPAEDAVRILLCVHDELLLEVAEPIADAVADQCRQAMTAAVPGGLSVPLRVSVAKGKAWSELA